MGWQLSANQKAVPGAQAGVECGTLFKKKVQNFTQASCVYHLTIDLFVKPGPGSQETRVLDELY